MAKFRAVHTNFWEDQKVRSMTREERLLFLYLLTNDCTKQIGIYEISVRLMAFETGLTLEKTKSSFESLINKYKLMKYNPDTREIAIKNWGKYNFLTGFGKPVEDCVRSELKEVKDRGLILYVAEHITYKKIRDVYELFAERPYGWVGNKEVNISRV
ncbi:hypothetical protein [Lederbergia panacisoli]|uniref:hypothetical protein n=1 Tax=Lederbergia panacisoli TaxID=1255251 RepID=UPI00214CFC17|nr:hypothetical protein [Lederbergia panacisoli]MCR2823788.1 hypothetical protein [Lederbergia panacisoli]